MRFSLRALLSFLCFNYTFALPAFSAPHVYTTAFLLDGDLQTCINESKDAGAKTKFTDDIQVIKTNDQKGASIYAVSTLGSFSMAVECDPPGGTVSIAVSGINNDDTFQLFKELLNSF